jgi:hypothetical protein
MGTSHCELRFYGCSGSDLRNSLHFKELNSRYGRSGCLEVHFLGQNGASKIISNMVAGSHGEYAGTGGLMGVEQAHTPILPPGL